MLCPCWRKAHRRRRDDESTTDDAAKEADPPSSSRRLPSVFRKLPRCRPIPSLRRAEEWPTIGNSLAGYFSGDTDPVFADFLEMQTMKPTATTCTQFLAEFFKFHTQKHVALIGENLAKIPGLPKTESQVDELLADLCRLAFEMMVLKPSESRDSLAVLAKSYRATEPLQQQDRNRRASVTTAYLSENYPKLQPLRRMSVQLNAHGFLEVAAENGEQVVKFSNSLIADYLAALQLSASFWVHMGTTISATTEAKGNNLSRESAKRIVDNFGEWKSVMAVLPHSLNVVKFFFGLFPKRITPQTPLKMSRWLQTVAQRFYANFHGHSLVARFLETRASTAPIGATALLEMMAKDDANMWKKRLFHFDKLDWQLALVEIAYECGNNVVAQYCLSEALWNESFYAAQSGTLHCEKHKIYYFIVCLAFLLRRGEGFCNLELSGLHLTGSHLRLLATLLNEVNSLSLQSIDFSQNDGLSKKSGDYFLCQLLMRSSRLMTLDLSRCSLTDKAVLVSLSQPLKFMPLNVLNLSHNSLTDQGCRLLLEHLSVCFNLTNLQLAGNKLTPNCCDSIGNYLQRSNLVVIDLSHNKLYDVGAKCVILGALKANYAGHVLLRSTCATPKLFSRKNVDSASSCFTNIMTARKTAFSVDVTGILSNGADQDPITDQDVKEFQQNIKVISATKPQTKIAH